VELHNVCTYRAVGRSNLVFAYMGPWVPGEIDLHMLGVVRADADVGTRLHSGPQRKGVNAVNAADWRIAAKRTPQ